MSTGAGPLVVLGTRWTEHSRGETRSTGFWRRRAERVDLAPRRFLDWTIDDQPLRDRLTFPDGRVCDDITFLTEGSRGDRFAIASLRALLRENVPGGDPWVQYADGRAGVLFCPQCGGLDCGAVSADVHIGATTVEWRNVAFQIDVPGGVAQCGVPWFTLRFDRAQYEATVREVLAAWTESPSPAAG